MYVCNGHPRQTWLVDICLSQFHSWSPKFFSFCRSVFIWQNSKVLLRCLAIFQLPVKNFGTSRDQNEVSSCATAEEGGPSIFAIVSCFRHLVFCDFSMCSISECYWSWYLKVSSDLTDFNSGCPRCCLSNAWWDILKFMVCNYPIYLCRNAN